MQVIAVDQAAMKTKGRINLGRILPSICINVGHFVCLLISRGPVCRWNKRTILAIFLFFPPLSPLHLLRLQLWRSKNSQNNVLDLLHHVPPEKDRPCEPLVNPSEISAVTLVRGSPAPDEGHKLDRDVCYRWHGCRARELARLHRRLALNEPTRWRHY